MRKDLVNLVITRSGSRNYEKRSHNYEIFSQDLVIVRKDLVNLVITRSGSRNYEKRSRNYEKRSRNYEIILLQ